MTPLETLLVCLIAAAGVGMLRFAAHAPAERARGVVQEAFRTPAEPVNDFETPRSAIY